MYDFKCFLFDQIKTANQLKKLKLKNKKMTPSKLKRKMLRFEMLKKQFTETIPNCAINTINGLYFF